MHQASARRRTPPVTSASRRAGNLVGSARASFGACAQQGDHQGEWDDRDAPNCWITAVAPAPARCATSHSGAGDLAEPGLAAVNGLSVSGRPQAQCRPEGTRADRMSSSPSSWRRSFQPRILQAPAIGIGTVPGPSAGLDRLQLYLQLQVIPALIANTRAPARQALSCVICAAAARLVEPWLP